MFPTAYRLWIGKMGEHPLIRYVSDLLRNVNDRHNRPYVNNDGTLNYEFGVLKVLPVSKTSYSIRREALQQMTSNSRPSSRKISSRPLMTLFIFMKVVNLLQRNGKNSKKQASLTRTTSKPTVRRLQSCTTDVQRPDLTAWDTSI